MSTINAKKILETEFPLSVRSRLLPLLMSAATVTKMFFAEAQPGYFSGPLGGNIKGHLFSFSLLKQFSPGFLPKTLSLQSRLLCVNNFGRMVPEVCTANAIMYIVRGRNLKKFPRPQYLKNRAQYNGLGQLVFPFGEERRCVADKEPICVMLYYGSYDNETIRFAHLILPDSKLEYPLHSYNLFEEMSVYESPKNPEPIEIEYAKLIPSLEREHKRLKGEDSD